MALVMTEVAALEVQGMIKKMDAAYTWPHHSEPGYHTTAIFVRTKNDTPYLIYCPKLRTEIEINEESYSHFLLWEPTQLIRKFELRQGLYQVDDIMFLIIELKTQEPTPIKKAEIEKMFGIKVVD